MLLKEVQFLAEKLGNSDIAEYIEAISTLEGDDFYIRDFANNFGHDSNVFHGDFFYEAEAKKSLYKENEGVRRNSVRNLILARQLYYSPRVLSGNFYETRKRLIEKLIEVRGEDQIIRDIYSDEMSALLKGSDPLKYYYKGDKRRFIEDFALNYISRDQIVNHIHYPNHFRKNEGIITLLEAHNKLLAEQLLSILVDENTEYFEEYGVGFPNLVIKGNKAYFDFSELVDFKSVYNYKLDMFTTEFKDPANRAKTIVVSSQPIDTQDFEVYLNLDGIIPKEYRKCAFDGLDVFDAPEFAHVLSPLCDEDNLCAVFVAKEEHLNKAAIMTLNSVFSIIKTKEFDAIANSYGDENIGFITMSIKDLINVLEGYDFEFKFSSKDSINKAIVEHIDNGISLFDLVRRTSQISYGEEIYDHFQNVIRQDTVDDEYFDEFILAVLGK